MNSRSPDLRISRSIWPVILAMLFLISGCEKAFDLKKPSSDPVAIFDEVWNVMNERYAMFSIKNVNWDENYRRYRSMVTPEITDHSLFRLTSDMLESLQDGHVALISDKDTGVYNNFYKAYAVNFNYANIINTYLKNDYKKSGPLIYKIVQNVAYVYYNSFSNDISEEQVSNLFQEIATTKGLIIDIRSNYGGNPANADKLFRHFITERTLAKYELRKKGTGRDEFHDPEPYYIFPGGQTYTKPVVVLTNRSCFSTCNDFVLYMSGLKNVTLIGDQTGGGGGIPYNYLLGNGWRLRYTATITLSPDKKNIENGIQPDQNIGISTLDELSGRDPILEKAFQFVQ
jgi:hypothetical protein